MVLGGRYRPIRRRRVLGRGEVPEDRNADPGKQLEQFTSSEVKITLSTLLLLGYERQRVCGGGEVSFGEIDGVDGVGAEVNGWGGWGSSLDLVLSD